LAVALHDLTAVEQARAMRAGEISSVELTDHYLRRMDDLNDLVGAFATITAELALDQARAADARRTEGQPAASLIDGLVVPVKDLHLYEGVRTRFGTSVADVVAPVDEFVAARLRAAGTVMTGKTTTPDFRLSVGLPTLSRKSARLPAHRGTSPVRRADRAAGRQRPLPPAWRRWPTDPTAAARSESRRARVASWA
jgi:amidase